MKDARRPATNLLMAAALMKTLPPTGPTKKGAAFAPLSDVVRTIKTTLGDRILKVTSSIAHRFRFY